MPMKMRPFIAYGVQLIWMVLFYSVAFAQENAAVKKGMVMTPSVVPVQVRGNFHTQSVGANVLVDADYFIWGVTAMHWHDGKVHIYYSRWPKRYGFGAWLTHCEIAHAVGNRAEGPFRTTGTVIASRHLDGWDRVNAHNPSVCVVDGRIYLYYISNKLAGEFDAPSGEGYPSDAWLLKNRGKVVRNRQCIGVASATQPSGPFSRADHPVVEPHGLIKNIAVNPAVSYQNGKFIMIVKGDDVRRGGSYRIQLVGASDKAFGPFTFQKKAIYDKAQTEDACIWYDQQEGVFHSLLHVMGQPVLVHLTSSDGIKWSEAEPFIFMQKQFKLSDGSTWKPKRVERPFVLTDEKGRAQWIYLAIYDQGNSGNVVIPFEQSLEKE